MNIAHLDHLNLTVADLDATIDWYGRVFGFTQVEEGLRDGLRWAVIRGGEAMLCIYERKDLQFLDRFGVQDKGLHAVSHFALRIDDVEAWEATIEREKVDVIYDGEVEWPRSRSWYVTDPTGYEVEVVAWNNDSISFAPMTQAV